MSKATILMVEDDAILAMDLQRMISQQGYTVLASPCLRGRSHSLSSRHPGRSGAHGYRIGRGDQRYPYR